MKNATKSLLLTFAVLLAQFSGYAETVRIYDDSFSVVNIPGSVGGSGILSGRWGIWNSGSSTFTQNVTSTLNAGFVDFSTPELEITLNQINNAVYTSGTLLALAIFTNGTADAQAVNYNSTFYRAILTDPLWQAVGFANNANFVNYSFSANTTAVVGTYNYNSGAEVITLVPEPTTGSLLLLGGLGMVALRRLRKV